MKLLTDEEINIAKILLENKAKEKGFIPVRWQYDEATTQSQHYKDTHPPKLDKPDGEGWWWHLVGTNMSLCKITNLKPTSASYYECENLNGEQEYTVSQGTWQRAIVPE